MYIHARPSHSPPSYRPGKVDELETLKILNLGITLPYLGGTLALTGIDLARAATTLQVPALLHFGAVFIGVTLPGLIHAPEAHTETAFWVVSVQIISKN